MKKEINDIMETICRSSVKAANEKLRDMTAGGFPYSYEEVKISVQIDSAGIYVHSGKTPVCSIPRAGDQNACIQEISDRIFDTVDSTRSAIERRSRILKEAEDLKDEDRKTRAAISALEAAGCDTSILGIADCSGVKEVTLAARKAVNAANKAPLVGVADYSSEWRMSVCSYSSGIVVKVGDKPCLVTRFPKTHSPKTIERMKSFLMNDISAISDSRRAYFEKVSLEMAREERLHEISRKLDAAEAQLMAAVM